MITSWGCNDCGKSYDKFGWYKRHIIIKHERELGILDLVPKCQIRTFDWLVVKEPTRNVLIEDIK